MNSVSKFIHYSLNNDDCVICSPENPRMQVKTKLFPQSVPTDSLDDVDRSRLAFVLRNPIAVWISCGEPFLSPNGKFFVSAFFQASVQRDREINFMSL